MMENNSGVMYKVLWVEDEDKSDSILDFLVGSLIAVSAIHSPNQTTLLSLTLCLLLAA